METRLQAEEFYTWPSVHLSYGNTGRNQPTCFNTYSLILKIQLQFKFEVFKLKSNYNEQSYKNQLR